MMDPFTADWVMLPMQPVQSKNLVSPTDAVDRLRKELTSASSADLSSERRARRVRSRNCFVRTVAHFYDRPTGKPADPVRKPGHGRPHPVAITRLQSPVDRQSTKALMRQLARKAGHFIQLP